MYHHHHYLSLNVGGLDPSPLPIHDSIREVTLETKYSPKQST